MTFTFDSSITGPVHTVSAYISGAIGQTLTAYDASGIPIGQSVLPLNAPANFLFSVTSTSNSIAKVTFQGGAFQYLIDDFTF